jgi:hypothetical protein
MSTEELSKVKAEIKMTKESADHAWATAEQLAKQLLVEKKLYLPMFVCSQD